MNQLRFGRSVIYMGVLSLIMVAYGYAYWWNHIGGQPARYRLAQIWVMQHKAQFDSIIQGMKLDPERVTIGAFSGEGVLILLRDEGEVALTEKQISLLSQRLRELRPPSSITYQRMEKYHE